MAPASPLALIVEDDPASAEALSLILRDWGAGVLHARTGSEAEAAISARATELKWIITDFHLGDGEDGISVVQRLARRAPNARVLVLSGSFRGRANDLAAKLGYEVMPKPARAAAIVAWLEQE